MKTKNLCKVLLTVLIIPILFMPSKAFASGTSTKYTVKNGDSLWEIATTNKTTVANLKLLNNMKTDVLNIGQVVKLLPDTMTPVTVPIAVVPSSVNTNTQQVKHFPLITYIVKSGDTATSIGKKFNVLPANVMKYNYIGVNDWLNAGQKIAINGYAPRNYEVVPGMDKSPTRYGHAVDWFNDGQYILKRNEIFTIVDFSTRKQFTVKVLGGYNHADIEPLTSSDAMIMKSLFGTWTWTPRPVVIFKDGMNIAGSLSGMPHSFDTTPNNGVNGHCDLYLKNSIPHPGAVSKAYVQQHYSKILISGKN